MAMEGTSGPRHMTPDEFRALGYRAVDWIARYMEVVEEFPVSPEVSPGAIAAMLPQAPPERGAARVSIADELALGGAHGVGGVWEGIFADLAEIIVPGLTHWQSPRFFGFFPCNASGPAILGEFLSAGLNVNGMLWATSPAATELETRMLDWMAQAYGLPEAFHSGGAGGGCIQGTASEATLVALLAARRRALARAGGARGDLGERLVVYASTQAHSSVVKAAMIAGFADGPEDRRRVRLVETDAEHAMDAGLLEQHVAEDVAAGLVPCFVCATVGTTSSTANDPVEAILAIAQQHGMWLHVDAAHSGNACVCPEMRWMWRGVEGADSVCVNPHKWLLTNFDCDLFWTRDRASVIGALSVTPEYLRNRASEAGAVIDYRDWQIPLGRRFRALKLWFVVRHYGLEGLREHIREHLRLALMFESWVRGDERFEVVAPRTVNLVCFRMRGVGEKSDARNRALFEAVNGTGRVLLSHTVLRVAGKSRFVLRMAIGGTMTRESDVREAWELVRAAAKKVG